jgi:23S rRNA pseudouridine1911/1915/1917 synthase
MLTKITDKTRLHKAVSMYLKETGNDDYTGPEIQRNIANYGVIIDGLLCKKRLAWVMPGQEIDIPNWPKRDHGNFDNVKILHETNDFVVVYKPEGVVVAPGAGHMKDNLLVWLIEKYPEISSIDSSIHPSKGLVHRIDKDTQGLLLVARNQDTLEFFQTQFKARTVVKKYLCVVEGCVEKFYHVKGFQCKSRQDVKKNILFFNEEEALKYDKESRYSESIIRPLAVCKKQKTTLLEVEIKTGRMHQIRLHCQYLGFPLAEDKVYNEAKHISDTFEVQTNDFEAGWRAWLGVEPIQELDVIRFTQLQNTIFNNTNYCLLSNYFKVLLPDETMFEAEYVDIRSLLGE